MVSYYWRLLRDIPRLMRLGLEGVLFWASTVLAPLVLWLQPGLRGWFDAHPTPAWLPVTLVAGGLGYGLARANYDHVESLRTRLEVLDRGPSYKMVDLVGFAGDWKRFLATALLLTKADEEAWLKETDGFQEDWKHRVLPHLSLREKNRVQVLRVDVPLLHLEVVAGKELVRGQRIARVRAEIEAFLSTLDKIIEGLPDQS